MGPEAIRRASFQVDLYDISLGFSPSDYGIIVKEFSGIGEFTRYNQYRNRDRVNKLSVDLNEVVEAKVRREVNTGHIVGLIGGEHSVSYGGISYHAKTLAKEGKTLSVLQIDAHHDLRKAYQGFEHSHASIMRNVHDDFENVDITAVGVRDICEEEYTFARNSPRIHSFYDVRNDWNEITILETLAEDVYVTFDIDGLDPSLCPHTGTPVPGGLSFKYAMFLLETVARQRNIVGFDLVEVSASDFVTTWDANVGARVLYRLCGGAIWSQEDQK